MKKDLTSVRNTILASEEIRAHTGLTQHEFNNFVISTKISPTVIDPKIRLGIWARDPKELNGCVSQFTIVVDVHVPLERQVSTGVGWDILDSLEMLRNLGLGRGVHTVIKAGDLQTNRGWWLGNISFIYNKVTKN